MIQMIKNFLCNTDPANIVFPIIILIVCGVLAAFTGIKHFLIITGIILGLFAIVAGIGYGLYRAVTYFQANCKE